MNKDKEKKFNLKKWLFAFVFILLVLHFSYSVYDSRSFIERKIAWWLLSEKEKQEFEQIAFEIDCADLTELTELEEKTQKENPKLYKAWGLRVEILFKIRKSFLEIEEIKTKQRESKKNKT